MELNYIRHVDGLRAFAVLATILFHYKIPYFQGGYIGVDIFFVISGFLMTWILSERFSAGTFRFLDFYKSRFYRIFPALFIVSAATFFFALFIFSPDHLKNLSHRLFYVLSFTSNFFYWKDVSYFKVLSNYDPFVPTWSLGIEIQYYLTWPIIFFFAYKFFLRHLKWFLLLVIIVSLGVSEFFLNYTNNFVYYNLPFRYFEFGIGSLGFLILQDKSLSALIKRFSLTVPLAGLLLISLPVFLFDSQTRFPGLNALMPCIGAVFLIVSCARAPVLFLLNNPVSVYVGRISYVLYLVHWPIFVFFSYVVFSDVSLASRMALIAVSCLIAVPLHHFVENAYRGRAISRRKVLLLLSATSLIVGLAVFAVFTGGWPQRLSQEQRQVLQTINQEAETYRRAYERKFPMPDETAFDPSIHAGLECSYDYAGDIDILVSCLSYNLSAAGGFLVIGDSNGGNTFQALRMAYKKTNFAFLQQSGCAAAAFRENPRSQNWCFRDVDQILDRLVSKKKIRGVILSSRWVEQPYEHVAETIEKIQALKAPVLLVGPTPMLRHNLFETIFMKRLKDLSNLQSLPLQDPYFSRDVLKVEAELKMTAKRYDIPYFSKVNFWCPKNVCTIFIAGMDAPLFLDTQHLTKSGLTYFAQQLRGELAVRDFIVSADN